MYIYILGYTYICKKNWKQVEQWMIKEVAESENLKHESQSERPTENPVPETRNLKPCF